MGQAQPFDDQERSREVEDYILAMVRELAEMAYAAGCAELSDQLSKITAAKPVCDEPHEDGPSLHS